ncbi:Protein kinase domain-containing protein [Mycena indigotica]|uniref:Protein kinase domain-containing protein n=1 Tax=Mycena indigotica TaxID=2126181 RepID=A0A8H6SH06_9AGAR|nr:Protein kinase domain-containing protein [Mycena indigotica]KAF7299209.1 Protein kinase domain-containing protein [Mycena indigotica]
MSSSSPPAEKVANGDDKSGSSQQVQKAGTDAKPTERASRAAFASVMMFFRFVTGIFFREIRTRGSFNIPQDGAVIFVGAPHNNQFLDMILGLEAYKESGRRVQFLVAASSMKRAAVGFFARLVDSIPVARASDNVKPGTGRIHLSPDDPCLVLGEGTCFKSEFTARMQIMLPKSLGSVTAEITDVISDTELRIKKEFSNDQGKCTDEVREATESGSLSFRRLPYVDQQQMYHHVYNALSSNGSIGIFPEGGSHDRTDLLPLKAGVSIMALGAMANNPGLNVQIVPVGLSYFHAHKFRSRAVVEFGRALQVPAELVELFKKGGAQKREAVANLLDLIFNALKTVTVLAPDYDTLMLIQATRRLYKTPSQHLTLGQVVELNRRLLEGYEFHKDEPRVQKLRAEVLRYNRMVRDMGLRDHQVPRAERLRWKTLALLVYRMGLLSVWSVFALPGLILNGPIFILASIISRKKAREALAASRVKIAARDVLASWKVLISLGVAPVLYLFYAIIGTIVAIRTNAPLKWRLMTPLIVLFGVPAMSYAALKFGEAGMDVLKSLPPLIVALIPGQQRSLDQLKAMRVELANEVSSLINDFGPQQYPDFDQWRILVPSASVPPSGGTPGLWRRKSGNGGVDAPGLGLTHPMTWLDERLFGFRAAATAPNSDDEGDNGDYDNVIGFIPGASTLLSAAAGVVSKSRNSSYADLQKLRSAQK